MRFTEARGNIKNELRSSSPKKIRSRMRRRGLIWSNSCLLSKKEHKNLGFQFPKEGYLFPCVAYLFLRRKRLFLAFFFFEASKKMRFGCCHPGQESRTFLCWCAKMALERFQLCGTRFVDWIIELANLDSANFFFDRRGGWIWCLLIRI